MTSGSERFSCIPSCIHHRAFLFSGFPCTYTKAPASIDFHVYVDSCIEPPAVPGFHLWLAGFPFSTSNVKGFQRSLRSLCLSDVFFVSIASHRSGSPSRRRHPARRRWPRERALPSSLTLAWPCRRFLLNWLASLLSINVCSGRHRRSGPDNTSSKSTPSSLPRSPSAMSPLLDLPSPRRHCGNVQGSWTRRWPISIIRLQPDSSRLL